MKPYPKEIFVELIVEDDKTSWMNAQEDAGEFADINEVKTLGRYELQETVVVETCVSVETLKP